MRVRTRSADTGRWIVKRWTASILLILVATACSADRQASPTSGGTQALGAGGGRTTTSELLVGISGEQVVRSFSGRSIAYVPGSEAGLYEASGRRWTEITVEQPDEGASHTFRLMGDFEPEAFSTDESKLFLIEHLSDVRYRVRMLKLRTGKVAPIGRLTKLAPDSMRGVGRVQVYAPTGDALYTLYTRQQPNTAHRTSDNYHNDGRVHAFVHVLSLEGAWAHCVDLKMPFGMDPDAINDIAVSKDGTFVYATDGAQVAVIETHELKVWEMVAAATISEVTKGELIRPADQAHMRAP
jgi:hypothetical protein